ncbi:MAG: VWA domain-containing protein [Aureliella sp.]
MILASPEWMILSLLAILPWLGPWKGAKRSQNILRSCLFLALGLALSQPHWISTETRTTQVVVWDGSASCSPEFGESLQNQFASDQDASTRHLIWFGASPAEGALSSFDTTTELSLSELRGESPISLAISRAEEMIPEGTGGRVFVVSDGLATIADDYRASTSLHAREIELHWIRRVAARGEPRVLSVHRDGIIRRGATSRLLIDILLESAGSGTLELRIENKLVASTTVQGNGSELIQVPMSFEPTTEGFVPAEFTLVTEGTSEASSLGTTLPIHAPMKLLYLGERQIGGSGKLDRFLNSGFSLSDASLENPSTLETALERANLLMLDDLASERLSPEIEEQIVQAVTHRGMGLVMSGGRNSFGAGGWHDRPIESLLPVEFVQKEEKRDPSTSLVVVIDTSGSMTGVRVQLAKEVARLAMRRLLPHDKVGIVEFFGAKRWAAPLQPASNAIELQRALNRMDAGGGTVILPALEEAFYGLQNVDTRYKHVLVLTDGGVESGDFESLLRRMSNEGINVSTVLTGGGYHSEFLVNIANWGKGRFYNVPNRFNLPEILLKQPSTTKLPSYRPGIHTVQARGGMGWWSDVDVSQLPALNGYVEGKARSGAEVLIETQSEKHPVLATWRYGLGRVTALGTEPFGEGTSNWNDWQDYGQALTRVLQRTAADSTAPFRFHIVRDGVEVQLHAVRRLPRSGSTSHPVALPLARWADSSTPTQTLHESIDFQKKTEDHFVAYLRSPLIGEQLRLETTASTGPMIWQPLTVDSCATAESRVSPLRAKEFGEMIAFNGGNVFEAGEAMNLEPVSPKGRRLIELSPWLFGLCLLLFITELILRRLPAPTGNSSDASPSAHSSQPNASAASIILLLLVLPVSLPVSIARAQGPADAKPAPALLAGKQVDLKLKIEAAAGTWDGSRISTDFITEVFDSAVLQAGSVEPTLEWLSTKHTDLGPLSNQFYAELEVALAARLGELSRAFEILSDLCAAPRIKSERYDLQIWQAKLADALGNVDQAKELYELLAEQDLPEEDQQAVRLRLALMDLIGAAPGTRGTQSNSAKLLIELAEQSEDLDFRNRAANVLAVQNKHADAIKLFTIQGEGTAKFRSASRVAEWAIRAKNRKKAIESAWMATDSAQLKRDRNYALALLVESYRLTKKKAGLEELVTKIAERNQGEKASAKPITPEMRTVWISLLRELGKYDEAIALFKETQSNAKGFTVEMRRELLEMEGEAGYEDRMLDSYRTLIQTEPNELIWRAGLTQILLEKGKDQEARDLWSQFVEATDNGPLMLQSAQTLGEYGIDDLAAATIERMVAMEVLHGQALLYWSDLQSRRGETEAAEATLNRVQDLKNVGDDVRAELASAYERLGRQDKAIEVNEQIRASRETVAEDLEMRLAWLYSEVGDEEKALDQWLALWRKVTSVPRRRYVEDRLMTVASRLGTLADIAIELEEKLADGTVDDREAGLLVRIYSRVNDSVAATEISEEYMSRSGKNEVEQLQEKGRIYQICNDYWNYEKVVERLIEVDPEGRTEYLRQLALSMLERGKAQEARKVLFTLRENDDGKDSIGGEFEAGVLSLVGMNAEAAQAYRKGIATHPDRIESYLLLANLLKDMGKTERAVGMFQYLAETADRDDLFTIAIDGILNMEAKGPAMQWARRITLERLAGREDKNYLYQLLADLSFEVNDKNGQIRALENSLAVSGTRRLSVLRECMELSSRIRGGVYYSGTSRGPTNKGNLPFFAFGRRLIGLGELMPPQVFLDLGQAFLDDGDSKSAERTFGMARNLADPRSYQREVAMIFEKAAKTPEALVRYDKLLRTSPSDAALIARVAKLNEQVGEDSNAFRFYERGLNLLLSQTPLTTEDESSSDANSFFSSNRDAYQMYSDELLQGILITATDSDIEQILQKQLSELRKSFDDIQRLAQNGRKASKLGDAPRIEKRSDVLRKMCHAFDRMDVLEQLDLLVAAKFPEEKDLLASFAKDRLRRGRYDSLRRTLASLTDDDPRRGAFQAILGEVPDISVSAKLAPTTMWQQLLPLWMEGKNDKALRILRRVDQTQGRAPGMGNRYIIVNGMAVLETSTGASDVTAWMRMAIALGDNGLALQIARKQIQTGGRYNGPQFRQQMKAFAEILDGDNYSDLVRFAANFVQEDEERIADYLWLIAKHPSELQDVIPDDDKLLEMIEDGNLEIGYYFPFQLAMEVFPKSIRAEALSSVLGSIIDKYRPRELIQVPFTSTEALDDETAEIVLEWLESGIAPAIQDDYLRYSTYALPRAGKAVRNVANTQFAIRALDLFLTDAVRQQEKEIPRIAQYLKAVVLHQSGDTEEAIELVLESYDPTENITDYYLKNSRDYAYKELVPRAPERFLAKLDEKAAGKRTVQLTDQKILIAKQCGDAEVLRSAYRQAISDHPDQAKYLSAYERLEQAAKRTASIISLYETQLSAANEAQLASANEAQDSPENASDSQAPSDEAKQREKALAAKIPVWETRLASLWKSVEHPINELKYFSLADDRAAKKFDDERKARELNKEKDAAAQDAKESGDDEENEASSKTAAAASAPAAALTPASPVQSVRIAPATVIGSNVTAIRMVPATSLATNAAASSSSDEEGVKTYASTMAGVKSALDDENEDAAKKTLRKVWRNFPPIEPSPYGYAIVGSKRVNGLTWPASKPKQDPNKEAKEPTDEEKKAAEEKRKQAAKAARNRARGGLATFVPPAPAPRKQPEKAWLKLAEYPFAADEMRRILRAQTSNNVSNVQDVSIALLQQACAERGEENVFQSVLQKIYAGNLSDQVLVDFFALLERDDIQLTDADAEVIEVLMSRLDLTNVARASQLAELCMQLGQTERAKALFTHCSMLNGAGVNSYANLLKKVQEHFEGTELIQLAKRMFRFTKRETAQTSALVTLLSDVIGAQKAAEDVSELIEGLLDNNRVETFSLAADVTALFAEAGEHGRAQATFAFLLDKHGELKEYPENPFGGIRIVTNSLANQLRINRAQLLKIFPDPKEEITDYQGWLTIAAQTVHDSIATVDPAFAAEVLLAIAYRQCQIEDLQGAKSTLAVLAPSILQEAPSYELLAIDVLRLANETKRAFELQQAAFQGQRLTHLRFGDFLHDAFKTHGEEFAANLLDQLAAWSLDRDLLATAEKLGKENELIAAKHTKLIQEIDAAKAEMEERKETARNRAKQRAKWKKADSAESSASAKKAERPKSAKS